MFDETAHSRLCDPAPSKDLHGVSRGVLRGPSTVHFHECDLTGEFGRLFLVRLAAQR